MNKQGKNGIGWCDFTYNPIKGMCPVNCKLPDGREYCYARKMYKRFGWNPETRIAEEYPHMIPTPLFNRKREIVNQRIFICSTFELFHPCVKKEWRNWIFDNIKYNFNSTFQILTKMPENIDREMPDNVWLGVTVTNNSDIDKTRIKDLLSVNAKVRFISFEPMLDVINLSLPLLASMDGKIQWFIIGRLTGHGRKYDPRISMIKYLMEQAEAIKAKVFLKDNLQEIVSPPLIQEFPVADTQ